MYEIEKQIWNAKDNFVFDPETGEVVATCSSAKVATHIVACHNTIKASMPACTDCKDGQE